VSAVCLLSAAITALHRLRDRYLDHLWLSVSGASLLWLLSCVASGLLRERLSSPLRYSRDVNRWLRLYCLEFSRRDGQLRCLSLQQIARRRGRREKEQQQAERERESRQRQAAEEAERDRQNFLLMLEREEQSDAAAGGSSSSNLSSTADQQGEEEETSSRRLVRRR
jgi:hypothetical protein